MKDEKNALLDAIEGDRVVTINATREAVREVVKFHRRMEIVGNRLHPELHDALDMAQGRADTIDHDAFVVIRIKGNPLAVA